MKFARYLRDTQTPEWKRAYIDYRGLKKRIAAIRSAHTDAADPEGGFESVERATPQVPASPASYARRELPGPSTRIGRMPSQGGFSLRSRHTLTRTWKGSGGTLTGAPKHPFGDPLPLNQLLPLLAPDEQFFFEALDEELAKIESFYLDREKEMAARTQALEDQLNELGSQARRLSDIYGNTPHLWLTKLLMPLPFLTKNKKLADDGSDGADDDKKADSTNVHDQDEFNQAKKKLKRAVIENYRGLEALNNYRILNITGIRKALKKFEKVTKIPCLQAYMSEKVDGSGISSGEKVAVMMKKMEDLYAVHLLHGDMRTARKRLRVGTLHKSHHFSTFRSGAYLGLAAPALAAGLYQSFQPSVRESISGWDGLLYAYAMFFLPCLFAVLVGLNFLTWARCRINYVFIFEFSTRTRLDHREYFEIPSLLLMTLCYAFYLSFAQVGAPRMAPSSWLLVWLGLAAIILFNPYPGRMMYGPSRHWFLKKTGKLLLSGWHRVEFADFWLGDQFCSLVFTLGNLPFLICSYASGFDDFTFQRCGSSSRFWALAFACASLPLLARTAQSVKRYADSGLITHLINGGKYASGVISYLCYYLWRHNGGYHATFVIWCIFNAVYSLYALTWDFLMDWSMLKPHVDHVLLRQSLLYNNYIPLYYFALLSNIVIRFIWVIYIPVTGPSLNIRTFIAGMLEILRRFQWNFFRLENEHLGNMDQYRITREVPLPFTFDSAADDEEEDE